MWVRAIIAIIVLFTATEARALDIRSWYSPLNDERPVRARTRFIVLHTTEGPGRGSLNALRRHGEAHYMVDERGRVTRIIHRDRVAYHAGTSMWEGRHDVDRSSIGIEVAGYHNRTLRPVQIEALRELIRQLQALYAISDERVLTHSMVAFGEPNRYHRYRHRGRKRCGMNLARTEVRAQLGLGARPLRDPDVAAGRLRVADHELHAVLYPSPSDSPSRSANAKARAARDQQVGRSASVADVRSSAPPQTLASTVEVRWRSARALVGNRAGAQTTIYLFPSGLVRTGAQLSETEDGKKLLAALPRGTRVVVDRRFGGYVTPSRAPSDIAGRRWNDPATLYRLPDGELVSGDRIDAARLPRSTLVFVPS